MFIYIYIYILPPAPPTRSPLLPLLFLAVRFPWGFQPLPALPPPLLPPPADRLTNLTLSADSWPGCADTLIEAVGGGTWPLLATNTRGLIIINECNSL